MGLAERIFKVVRQLLASFCGKTFVVNKSKYRVLNQIAEGGFGTVYLVSGPNLPGGLGDRSKRGKFALKRLLCQSKEQFVDAETEIQVHLKVGSHPSLMPLLAHDVRTFGAGCHEVLLLFPLFERGTLLDYVMAKSSQNTELEEAGAVNLFLQICQGVKVLHSLDPPLAHRDIKPQNVLLGSNGTATIMDFGSCSEARVDVSERMARLELQELAAEKSSMPYRAPELWDPSWQDISMVDERTDVWSLGCMLFAILFGQGYSPFECKFSDANGSRRDPFGRDTGTLKATASKRIVTVLPRECTFLGVLGEVPFPSTHTRSEASVELIRWVLQADLTRRPNLEELTARTTTLRSDTLSLA